MSVAASHSQSAIPGARFMDPSVLARIGNLELVSRAVVDGFINGMHKAPYFGASVDFAEHRGYVPGDDVRRIDWKLWARTDRYYVKEYEAESNSNFSVLLDVSKSMNYGSGAVTKLDYAKILTACLTNLVHHQRDRVGLVTFDDDVVNFVPSSAKHMEVVLHTLDKVQAGRPGSLKAPFQKMAEHFGRRGLLVIISDFYEVPDAFRKEYQSLVRAHLDALQQRFSANRIDYTVLNTSKPLDHALYSYLSARARMMKVR